MRPAAEGARKGPFGGVGAGRGAARAIKVNEGQTAAPASGGAEVGAATAIHASDRNNHGSPEFSPLRSKRITSQRIHTTLATAARL
ncbi:hypothetical protein EVAR_44350_1 [Eumeta japonica]|uniref:Uncharacterized protein n=1 Tax=Eumeta variegata TaxID=151549 RepID=A0A4C1X7T3_EUMVA|nr:hypothetical protein EVAR_44350_1 [Eumeta japonica]